MGTPIYRRKRFKRVRRRTGPRRPELTIEEILAWADAWFERHRQWPRVKSGRIPHALGQTWAAIDACLRKSGRGLVGPTSLAEVLERHRGVRNYKKLPDYRIEQILAWADHHRHIKGAWPLPTSGPIMNAPGETCRAVHAALHNGRRGLPGGSSLAQFLAEHRQYRNIHGLPRLSVKKVCAWADAYYHRCGRWPIATSGAIPEAPGETWMAVENALRRGSRGFRTRSSLAQLLERHRHVRNIHGLPPLTEEQILRWADAQHRRTGKWPKTSSGRLVEEPGESWAAIDLALRNGGRGLPGGSSLARLLQEHRDVPNHKALPPFTIEQILAWAREHKRRTGSWPSAGSGPVVDVPHTTWAKVDKALRYGVRGLPGGSSLRKLIGEACDGENQTE